MNFFNCTDKNSLASALNLSINYKKIIQNKIG